MSGLVQTVKTETFEMDYVHFGSGSRVLVVLPGMSLKSVLSWAEAILVSYKLLAEYFQIYLMDRRRKFPDHYSVEGMARDTVAALQALGVAKASFFGASQGGMMAQVIAAEHPEMTEKIILGSSACRTIGRSIPLFENWEKWSLVADLDSLVSNYIDVIYSPELGQKIKPTLVKLNADATSEEFSRFAVMARACLNFDYAADLPKIKCPVLVLGSRLDKVFYEASILEVAERLKAAGNTPEVYLYEKYGHACYDEAPDYRARMLDFLEH